MLEVIQSSVQTICLVLHLIFKHYSKDTLLVWPFVWKNTFFCNLGSTLLWCGWCSFEVWFFCFSNLFAVSLRWSCWAGSSHEVRPWAVSPQFFPSYTCLHSYAVCGNLQPSLNLHLVVCSLSEERLTCSPACELWLLHLVTFGLLPAAHRPRLWLHCSTTQARLTQFIKLISANQKSSVLV